MDITEINKKIDNLLDLSEHRELTNKEDKDLFSLKQKRNKLIIESKEKKNEK